MSDVGQKIRPIIMRQFGVRESEVTPNASFVDDFGADDQDVVVLVMALEHALGIELPDDSARHIRTVRDLVERFTAGSGP